LKPTFHGGLQILVAAALYLACKVEEQPKTVMKVVDAVYHTALKGRSKALTILAKQVRNYLVFREN
jgi:transcription initiation factor TFIIIB Brf1 subunit/transcription initiation factor TFIIB